MKDIAVSKYLNTYAEPLAVAIGEQLASLSLPGYQQALVIPVFRESSDFLYRLPKSDKKYLLIVVINQTDPTEIDRLNRSLLDDIRNSFSRLWQNHPDHTSHHHGGSADGRLDDHCLDGLCLDGLYRGDYYDVLLLDCVSANRVLDREEGVGAARKLGADTATALIVNGTVRSPWIFNTDADTYLPENYFDVVTEQAAALLYPFHHQQVGTARRSLAMTLYEFSLHYYVAGLKQANSPYAFHTIGSCIAFDYRHYCKVRGFPKRSAGEDFYLLNKINKTGRVKSLSEPTIRIAERFSERVPFGTGPAIKAIDEFSDPIADYVFYHPNCFLVLTQLLRTAQTSAQHFQKKTELFTAFQQIFAENLAAAALQPALNDTAMKELLATLGIAKALRHAHSHSKDAQQFLQHFHHWFDGFRTLKFIHYLRDHHFPSVAFHELIQHKALPPLDGVPRTLQQDISTWENRNLPGASGA